MDPDLLQLYHATRTKIHMDYEIERIKTKINLHCQTPYSNNNSAERQQPQKTQPSKPPQPQQRPPIPSGYPPIPTDPPPVPSTQSSTAKSASDPLMERYNELKSSKVIFPAASFVNAETLKSYLLRCPADILLLDIRPRQEFEYRHIKAPNVVCIEPFIVASDATDSQLEDSLLLSPEHEQSLFSTRNTFELVVLYDENSSSYSQSEPVENIRRAIFQNCFSKYLKRMPCLLVGGIQAWIEYAPTELESTSPSPSSQLKRSEPMRNLAHSSTQLSVNTATIASGSARIPTISLDAPSSSAPNSRPSSPSRFTRIGEWVSSRRSRSPSPSGFGSSSGNISAPEKHKISHHVRHLFARDVNDYFKQIPLTPPPSNSRDTPKRTSSLRIRHRNNDEKSLRPVSSQVTSRPLALVGLQNLGNTCYLNSMVQCLVGCTPLADAFLKDSYREYINPNNKMGTKGAVARAFADLTRELYVTRSSYINPKYFKSTIGLFGSDFSGYEQQDAQEFLMFILDGLHEDLNINGDKPRISELTEEQEKILERMSVRYASFLQWQRYLRSAQSIIVDIFQGQYQSRLECLSCHDTSTTYNAFECLSVPVPARSSRLREVSLESCFDQFVAKEILDQDDGWNCPRCKTKRTASKKLTISRLPNVLIVHLKRFQTSYSGSMSQKIDTMVKYPVDNLDLTHYWPDYEEEDMKWADEAKKGDQVSPFVYSLFAVVNHYGTLKGGHYTALVQRPGHGWFSFDDTRVNAINTGIVNQNAYVLFYVRQRHKLNAGSL
ncbi:hypothetical protein CANCADRAFT_32326 [Tortispora caseinolytica NRRL Y-17796]|uniref:Ubiquitin carboxyl-terminal hydrolase n=1 Tax=Tortispora caseinolytica NRRL Y-17796 TaxID=767744 RepID=A0A1E4TAT8_9ASCO|nr:hypothetical protein CANCADRAFT_32326 [Tortispora caseinolytica NRRL Y-17796]